MSAIFDYSAKTLDGREVSLADYRGQVLLIVNTASKCGFTPQYDGLETLFKTLHPQGLLVMGFPCNQFGRQEPGSESEIGSFCASNYGVSFPMFAKINVNGDTAHPLWRHLKREKKGIFGTGTIKWNFTKFLVDRAGTVVARYAPLTKPEKIAAPILKLL
ncbi:MAG: glutathione peroxidase [Rhizomicrobium sp.]|jgi:glutathione peroxidase